MSAPAPFDGLRMFGYNMHSAERITDGPLLHSALEEELAVLQRAHPAGFIVRLHVLGDFPTLEYVALWQRMLRQFPACHVFGFTAHRPDSEIGRSVAAATLELGLSRFAIRFSGAASELRSARVIGPGQKDPKAIICPAQTGGTDCCGTCGLCWQSERSIAFKKH